MLTIRPEESIDHVAIRTLHRVAFGGTTEAHLVDRLRVVGEGYLSFVATLENVLVGHILFTPVTLDGASQGGMGLAPMAVLPSYQRSGIGSALVRHGLAHLEALGCPFVIVLGHPAYYPRFGFEKASAWSITSQWDGVPDEAFLILPIDRRALPPSGGVARYRPEFSEVG